VDVEAHHRLLTSRLCRRVNEFQTRVAMLCNGDRRRRPVVQRDKGYRQVARGENRRESDFFVGHCVLRSSYSSYKDWPGVEVRPGEAGVDLVTYTTAPGKRDAAVPATPRAGSRWRSG
jgi:hypothetical protein